MSDKAELSRAGTMVATAKEGNALLDSAGRPDEDAHTRGQQKKIEDIKGEKKGTKKKGAPKKMSSMAKTAAEAKALVGKDLDLSGGRQLRKRPPAPEKAEAPPKKAKAKAPAKKAELKKEGTMQKTAKEGKEFLKRGRKPKAGKNKGKAAAKKNEKEKDDEEEKDETS
ncbi:DgyrCDS10177 [Dimorphilus gyrociliatus]|uniref:DgyrCDS10177 n=1 Tax=Dimorphilus gyrociliatus TaxID=2664684 RepID=A0A7I8VZG4_9ANNE|nr:DgyrCDS10177 [Dimorphilus gyrociliatus]